MTITNSEVLTETRKSGGFAAQLFESMYRQSLFLGVALFYFAALIILGFINPSVKDLHPIANFIGIGSFAATVAIFTMVIIQFYFVATVDKSEKPIKDLWRRMKAVLSHRDTMLRGLPMFFSLLIFMYCFAIFKSNITNFIPFSWDVTFDQWDKALHFGTRPWEWLQPVFGNIVATLILNLNYNLWFMIMYVFWIYFAFLALPGLDRTRFYISFFLLWSIGGSLSATLLSSAGPCYFGYVVDGVNPYHDLMQQLRGFNAIIPIWAVDTQDMLWQLRSDASALGGVTAMPSMHNGTALLFVLTTWQKSKILRNLLIAHMALIFLGSIHLGWHYAIDAYVAWAMTLVLWVTGHFIAKWWEARPQAQAFNGQFVGFKN